MLIVNRFMVLCGTRVRLADNMHLTPHGRTSLALAHHNTFAMLTADEQLYSHRPDFEWMNENGHSCNDWKLFSKDRIVEAIPS
jgi:hypothetical protein